MKSLLDERAGIVIGLFRNLFRSDGQEFGSLALGLRGISDGCAGVQWNAGYSLRSSVSAWLLPEGAWLGVNIEGMKYDGWPVARLIERELAHPLLLTKYRVRVVRPEMVTVSWRRDAWQAATRPPIKNSRILRIALDRLDGDGWTCALRNARECLDPKRDYRGRGRTKVTLFRSGQVVERDVTPHLFFATGLDSLSGSAMRRANDNLAVLHDFAKYQTRQPFPVGRAPASLAGRSLTSGTRTTGPARSET